MGKTAMSVAHDAMEILRNYAWPGNVRELQNVIKRALIMSDHETLRTENLPDELVARSNTITEEGGKGLFHLREQRIAAFERQYLGELLKGSGGDVSEAAREACVPRGTFYRLMKKYGIDPQLFR